MLASLFLFLVFSLLSSAATASESISTPASPYQERDFTKDHDGDVHISAFVYNDTDGNGSYGMDDIPMADVQVRMITEDGNGAMLATNIDGFANFKASVLNAESALIKEPGKYKFEIIPPAGWEVTSGNKTQEVEIERLVGSVGGFVSKPVPSLVGIARVDVDKDTTLSPHPLVKGGGKLVEQKANLKVDFEGLIKSIRIKKIPNGYEGFNWGNWVVTHQRFYKGEGYINGTTSGEYIGYNGSGHPMSISRDEPFDFIGGSFTAAWREAEGETVKVTAWRGNELAYQDEFELSRFGPVFFQANYDQITKVDFETKHYWQVVVDDLLFGVKGRPYSFDSF